MVDQTELETSTEHGRDKPEATARHTLPVHPLTVSTGALIIGGDYRGLGVVRSLGRHDIPVWVLTDEHRLAAHSRYCRKSFEWPDTSDSDRERFLIELNRTYGLEGWALIPTGDETAAFVASRHQVLSELFTLTTPPWSVFRWAYDKRLTNQLADRCNIARPKTWHPANQDEVASLDVQFPVILKPAFKTSLNPFTITKAWRVETRQELVTRYLEATAHSASDAIMVQEIISGDGKSQLSFAALVKDGHIVASITAQRTRQYPMDFGRASTFVETIDDQEVESASRRLLEAMQFTGLVEVEFKRDSRDGQLKLLDINPRVWGWHSLGYKAGVDFPYLQWRQIFGLSVDEAHSSSGIRWVRGLTDFPTVMKEIRAGRIGLKEYWRSIRPPAEWALIAIDDPIPALIEVPYTIRIAMRRGELKSDLTPDQHEMHDQSAAVNSPSET